MEVNDHNRRAWNREVEKGNIWTCPVDPNTVARARKGDWQVLLTPTRPVPREWFGPLSGLRILCLASGGGQQGPILAAAGARVTVLDQSPAQLEQDALVARREGLDVQLIQGDMGDLGSLEEESFDLIFHPVSNCFIAHVHPVWQECYRVLCQGGYLLAGFGNPLMYIFDFHAWDHQGKREVRYSIPYADVEQLPAEVLEATIQEEEPLEFGHSLEDQIGGQLKAGFILTDLFEDVAGDDFLDAHIPTFIATRAQKIRRT